MNLNLRDYQRNAVDQVKGALDRRPILVAPTGSGKTICAVALVEELGLPTLWLAHRKELIDQAAAHLEALNLWPGRIMAGHPPMPLAKVQVASVQTLVRRSMPPAELIVVDEAHHVTRGSSYERILDHYPDAYIVGLTATPFRLDGRGLGDVFGEIVVAAYTDDLCESGVLHDPRVYAGRSPDLRRVRISMGDYAVGELAKRANTDDQNADIVKTWLEKSPGRRTVAFAVDVAHSRAIVAAFRAADVPAEHIDGSTPKEEREAILQRLATGETLVVGNCMVLTEGWDLPALETAVLARPTASLNLHLQSIGRIMRACPDKEACIAEGQLVLTEHGLVPIERTPREWRVWDGTEWVSHEGPVYKGEREVITYAGLTATPDHWVKTEEGWKTLGQCAVEQIPIVQTGFGWAPIRERANHFRTYDEEGKGQEALRPCALRHVSARIVDQLFQYLSRPIPWVPSLQPTATCPRVAVPQNDGGKDALRESQLQRVRELRGPWDQIQLPFRIGRRLVGALAPWFEAGMPTGPHQQRRPLRTRQSQMVDRCSEHVSYSNDKVFRQIPRIQAQVPACEICRCDAAASSSDHDVRADRGKVEHSITQAKRRVWDLLNAGPRHCFTVSDRLVHNCIVLDHAGNHHVHGRVTRRIEYSLDSDRKVGESDPLRLRRCKACQLLFDPGEPCCPECGWKPEPATARERVPIHGTGRLEEFDDADFAYRAEFWRLIEGQRMAAGYRPGWSAYRYKERFGDWPVVACGELVDPDNATLDEKRAVYHAFARQAEMKGFKPGWAAYRYKDVFGCWPRGFVQDVRREALRERFRECARA